MLKNKLKKAALVITGLFTPVAIPNSAQAQTTNSGEKPTFPVSSEVSQIPSTSLSTRMSNAADISRSESLTKVGQRLQEIEYELYFIKEGIRTGAITSLEDVVVTKSGNREEFPGQRRGGGTHANDDRGDWPDRRVGGGSRAIDGISDYTKAKGDRDEFPGRRQGGGGGDLGGN